VEFLRKNANFTPDFLVRKCHFPAKSADFVPTFLSDAVNSVTFLSVTAAVEGMVKNLDFISSIS